jgi:arylsulfatase A-like enzyme
MHLNLLLAAAMALLPAMGAESTDSGKPNILIILTDDQGYGDLAAFGAPDLVTPHLDKLVAGGMRFDFFRASSSVCSPTRAALLTGLHPDRAGVPGVIRTHADNSWGYLSPHVETLPARLRPAGYHSALIGKWHLGLESPNTPNERGFDFFHGFLGDMMDDYFTHQRHGLAYMFRNSERITPQGHATDLFSDWASDYLRGRVGEASPFFLLLTYNAPHDPIQAPDEWLEKVKQRRPELPEKRARLVALIEHMDAGIGRVLDTLEETGLAKNTLVIFTSDNGGALQHGAFNGPIRDGKGSLYEGGLRVPFAARWPEKIAAGSRTGAAGVTHDLFPTVLEAAGAAPVAGIDGESLLPVLNGAAADLPERDLYFVRREGGTSYGGKTIEALIRGPWKLVQNTPFTPLELYHLREDPMEANDRAAANRKVFDELSQALRRQIQRGGDTPWQPAVGTR